jgi:hypothetical protein
MGKDDGRVGVRDPDCDLVGRCAHLENHLSTNFEMNELLEIVIEIFNMLCF